MLYCELCNSEKDLLLGSRTLFSEYNLICSHCLEKLINEECKPSPLKIADEALKVLNVSDDDIYGFTVEGCHVVVEYFNKQRKIESQILVTCNDEIEAVDVLCCLI